MHSAQMRVYLSCLNFCPWFLINRGFKCRVGLYISYSNAVHTHYLNTFFNPIDVCCVCCFFFLTLANFLQFIVIANYVLCEKLPFSVLKMLLLSPLNMRYFSSRKKKKYHSHIFAVVVIISCVFTTHPYFSLLSLVDSFTFIKHFFL